MVKHISHLLRVWAAATALAFFAFAPLSQAEVSATLDHSVVAEGDTLILHIQVLGDNDADQTIQCSSAQQVLGDGRHSIV